MIKVKKVCSHCGSEEIVFDAWSAWNEDKQQFELKQVFDNVFCEYCQGETKEKEIVI